MPSEKLELIVQPGRFAIVRMAADSPPPGWIRDGVLSAWIATEEEVTVVCDERHAPENGQCETGWRCLAVAGPLDFGLVGVVSGITSPLADAEVPVFVLSTYDTDYVLVRNTDLSRAVEALRSAGYLVRE